MLYDIAACLDNAGDAYNTTQMLRLITGLVSGQNRRYQQGGYDLDLAYVTDRIIAMSYPFEGTHGES